MSANQRERQLLCQSDGGPECRGTYFRVPLALTACHAPLAADFRVDEEAAHLTKLWSDVPDLQKYRLLDFVHAGGSGMVFKEALLGTDSPRALKIVRSKILDRNLFEARAHSVKPLSRCAARPKDYERRCLGDPGVG